MYVMMTLPPSPTLQRRQSVFPERKYLQTCVGLQSRRSRSFKYPISSGFTNILPKRGLINYTGEKGKIDPVNTADGDIWGIEGTSPCILILGTRWMCWLSTPPPPFLLGELVSGSHERKRWVGPIAGLNDLEKKNISNLPGTKLRFLFRLGTCSPLK